jgi:hypothetical protein
VAMGKKNKNSVNNNVEAYMHETGTRKNVVPEKGIYQ